MAVLGLFVINKVGSVMYHKSYSGSHLDPNSVLRLTSTFHVMYAITSQLSPVAGSSSGIKVIEAETFKFYCNQTATGLKFCVYTDRNHAKLDANILNQIYEAYSDYVLKHPFYEVDMLIVGITKWDAALEKILLS